MMHQRTDRSVIYLMAGLSTVALICYTAVLRLCRLEARQPDPQRAQLRRRLANLAHILDWIVSLVAVAAAKRMYQEEDFGGQHHPRWLKIYFMITGPLPTLGMLVAMITGHRWGDDLGTNPVRRRIHRSAAWVGYVSWWFSMLPLFIQPMLNRRRQAQLQAQQEIAQQA